MFKQYREFGYPTFGLPLGEKAPPPIGWQKKAGKVDVPEDGNCGISTEKFSVVDIDIAALIERFWNKYRPWITTVVRTPRGGIHAYFSGTTRNSQRKGWDIRGVGGYCLAAGSRNREGKVYELIAPLVPILELKPFPDELRKRPEARRQTIQELDAFRRITRARAYGKTIFAVSGSGGHRATFRFVCVMRDRFVLTPAEAFSVLLAWNETNAIPEKWSEAQLRHKIESAYEKATK